MSSSSISCFLFLDLLLFLCNAHHQPQDLQPNNMNMDPVEKETLFHIMEAMSSDREWRKLSDPNPCKPGSSWPGLECKPGPDNRLHVSRLDFGIPPNPTCKISATFPPKVFTLPYLQSVFFFSCFTHTKTSVSVPPSPRASSLQQLSLRSNPALVGPIPPQISNLKSLQVLTLSQNRLQRRIPTEITTMTSLIHLDLSYNLLTGTIPAQIGSLKNLIGLDLSYNSLSGTIPDSVGEMGILQKLDLSSNLLTGFLPTSLENVRTLVFLAASNNRLNGYSPRGIENLQSLQYFIMDDNPMSMPLPSELGKLAKLQELQLANSGYFGAIPLSFSELQNLTSLSLQNNKLTGQIPPELSRLSHIYHLNLSRNTLSGMVLFNETFMRRLGRNLDLSENPGLCLNESKGFESMKMGIGLCGYNRTAPLIHPQKRSEAAAALSSCVSTFLLSSIAILVLQLIVVF